MASFDTRTAYANDWQFLDAVDVATFRKRGGMSDQLDIKGHAKLTAPGARDWNFYANAMGLNSEQSVARFWPDEADGPPPEVDDLLIVDRGECEETWVIAQIDEMEYGPGWTFAVVKSRREE